MAQPWSDGTVGGYGTSYDGTTAHLLAATGHPAVKAVIPRFALFDAYHHIACPGGVPLDWFLAMWDAVGWTLDGYPERAVVALPMPLAGEVPRRGTEQPAGGQSSPSGGWRGLGEVRPVDGDSDRALLADARRDHDANWRLWDRARRSRARDDLIGADGVANEAGTPLGRLPELRAARVPLWLWSSWYDGAYAAAALAQLADPDLDVRVTIGPWAHGARMPVLGSPFAPDSPLAPDNAEQHRQMAAFCATTPPAMSPTPLPRACATTPSARRPGTRPTAGLPTASSRSPGTSARPAPCHPSPATARSPTRWTSRRPLAPRHAGTRSWAARPCATPTAPRPTSAC